MATTTFMAGSKGAVAYLVVPMADGEDGFVLKLTQFVIKTSRHDVSPRMLPLIVELGLVTSLIEHEPRSAEAKFFDQVMRGEA